MCCFDEDHSNFHVYFSTICNVADMESTNVLTDGWIKKEHSSKHIIDYYVAFKKERHPVIWCNVAGTGEDNIELNKLR